MAADTLPRREIRNELPKAYPTWLKFYDSIPLSVREASVIQADETLDRDAYFLMFGEKTLGYVRVMYRIERDFLLARVAEQLLAARATTKEVMDSMVTLRQARDIGPNSLPDLLLQKMGSVAIRHEPKP